MGCLCRSRIGIECALGRLKARFAALRRAMNIHLNYLPDITYACCEASRETMAEQPVLRGIQCDQEVQPSTHNINYLTVMRQRKRGSEVWSQSSLTLEQTVLDLLF